MSRKSLREVTPTGYIYPTTMQPLTTVGFEGSKGIGTIDFSNPLIVESFEREVVEKVGSGVD